VYRGFVKIWRKLKEWEWYKHPDTLALWVHLLLSANHKDNRWQGIDVKRGQLITGRHQLSEQTGLSPHKIRSGLKRLKSTSEITIQSTNRFSLITICQYETYSDNLGQDNQPERQPPTNGAPAKRQQSATNKNVKKEKNVKYKKELSIFNSFRGKFPGPKRGNETEFANFKKKHSNWKNILPLLEPALEKQKKARAAKVSADQWVPSQAALAVWINQSRWEIEVESTGQQASDKRCIICGKPSSVTVKGKWLCKSADENGYTECYKKIMA